MYVHGHKNSYYSGESRLLWNNPASPVILELNDFEAIQLSIYMLELTAQIATQLLPRVRQRDFVWSSQWMSTYYNLFSLSLSPFYLSSSHFWSTLIGAWTAEFKSDSRQESGQLLEEPLKRFWIGRNWQLSSPISSFLSNSVSITLFFMPSL